MSDFVELGKIILAAAKDKRLESVLAPIHARVINLQQKFAELQDELQECKAKCRALEADLAQCQDSLAGKPAAQTRLVR